MRKPGVCMLVGFVFVMFSISVSYAQDEAYEKGLHAYLKKDYKAAVKHLKEYVAKKRDPDAYYLLGYAHYELKRRSGPPKGRKDFWGDTDTAKYFREAYLIDPNFSPRSVVFKK